MPPKTGVERQPHPTVLKAVMALVEEGYGRSARRPLVLGLCGAQGSGKSTLARGVCAAAAAQGWRAATLSLDDLYLTRAERAVLAREVHPLLATRGVPGTHDVALGLDLLARLDTGEVATLPRFDKAVDDRMPEGDWEPASPGLDLLVFEGWCLGAVPEGEAALAAPVNALERDEDADGRWRRWVNERLAGDYQRLFARIDALVLLAAPERESVLEVVSEWRLEQERSGARAMDAVAVARFIQHYERLTRHILAEMPARVDLLIRLAPDRTAHAIARRAR